MEDMFTPLHLRVRGSERGGKSGREGRRQRGGGLKSEGSRNDEKSVCTEVKGKEEYRGGGEQ